MKFKWAILALTILFNLWAQADIYQINGTQYSRETTPITGRGGAQYQLALHQWKNEGTRKLAITSHGYGDHCAYMAPVHRQLLQHGYDILCLDLPGHGASSGNRYDIDQFETYEVAFEALLHYAQKDGRPMIYVGVSTGNVGHIQWMINHPGERSPFETTIAISPLIRSFLWDLSTFGLTYFGWIPYFPMRRYLNTPDYNNILRNDPYKQDFVPSNWSKQLVKWNENMKNQHQSNNTKMHIIFGTGDTVIDYKFCQNFLRDHFPQSEQHLLNDVGHIMFLEKPENQKKLYQLLEQLIP